MRGMFLLGGAFAIGAGAVVVGCMSALFNRNTSQAKAAFCGCALGWLAVGTVVLLWSLPNN